MAKTPGMFRWLTTPNVNKEEKEILREVQVGVYERLDDVVDKFIVCYVFEAGNERQDAARILGISQITLYKRLKRIKAVLKPGMRFVNIEKEVERVTI